MHASALATRPLPGARRAPRSRPSARSRRSPRAAPAGSSPDDARDAPPLPPHFDLDTSILLAGFAFESYVSPEGGLRDADVHGGRTAYFGDFVRDVFAGVLEVTVARAVNLPRGDLGPFGKSDPYLVARIDAPPHPRGGGGVASSRRTETRRRTLNPSFGDETLRLFVRRGSPETLTIRVLDEDLGVDDDLLGEVSIPFADLVAGAAPARALRDLGVGVARSKTLDRVPIEPRLPGDQALDRSAGAGELRDVTLRFVPFNPPAFAVASKSLKRAAGLVERVASAVNNANAKASSSGGSSKKKKKLAAAGSKGRLAIAATVAETLASAIDSAEAERARRASEANLWAADPEGTWNVLATESRLRVRGRAGAAPSRYEKLCFVENVETDTQCAVWRCAEDRTVVVAFRGTEMHRPLDFLTDVDFRLVPFEADPETREDADQRDHRSDASKKFSSRGGGGDDRIGDENERPRAHAGFLRAYESVRARAFAAVDDALRSPPREPPGATPDQNEPWHVFVTGHSLGGALGTFFALHLAQSVDAGRRRCTVTHYNFGSPRVGDRAFAARYDATVKDSVRVVNGADLVPTLPALLGYRHVEHGVRVERRGGGRGAGGADGGEGGGRAPAATVSGMGARRDRESAAAAAAAREGEGSASVSAEEAIARLAEKLGVVGALGLDAETAADAADALAGLASPEALAAHFEDEYYVALREARGAGGGA